MVFPRSLRKALASISFGVGFVWGVAGAFKLVFGVRMTLVFLPSLDLERMAAVQAAVVAPGLFALGAWLRALGPETAVRSGLGMRNDFCRPLIRWWPRRGAIWRRSELAGHRRRDLMGYGDGLAMMVYARLLNQGGRGVRARRMR